jgi:hypothetical protein
MPNDFDSGTGNDWDSPLALDQMKLALAKQPSSPSLEPTQNYPLLGKVAQGLSWAANPTDAQGNAIPHRGFNPLDLLPLESTAKVLNQINYGEPMFQTPQANVPLSTQIPAAVDVGLAAAPFVGKAGSTLLKAAGEGANARFLAGKPLIPGLGAEPQSAMFAVKPKGGNWIDKGQISFEKHIDNLKTDATGRPLEDATTYGYTPEVNTQVNAINSWIDKKLKPYVRNQMGTPEDPIRKLADEGVHHMPLEAPERATNSSYHPREELGFPKEGYATTPLGKQWELNSDNAIRMKSAKHFNTPNFEDIKANNPWVANLESETPVYMLSGREFNGLGFDHILDVLKEGMTTGAIHPEKDLPKISVADAVKRTHEYNEAMKEAQAKAQREDLKHANVVYKTNEGMVVKLDKPGQFARESDNMGHSVRGYEPPKGHEDWTKASGNAGSLGYGHGGWEGIKSGRAEVYSVRDADNKPHATIEVGKPQLVGEMAVDYRQLHPENFKKKYGAEEYEDLPKNVTQIKGPGNEIVDPTQRETVKSFLNSRKWGKVNYDDLENVGLTDLHNPLSSTEALIDLYGTDDFGILPQEAIDKLKAAHHFNPDAPRFMSRQEFRDFVDPPAEPKEHKMLQGVYRGYASDYDANAAGSNIFSSPQKRVADYYAQKRAGQTGLTPHVEMLLVDPFAGRTYGHSTPGSGAVEPMVTRAKELKPEDIKGRTQLYAKGGQAKKPAYNVDEMRYALLRNK